MTDDDMDARSGIARQLTGRCNNCYRKLPGEVGCSVNRPGWNWATPNLGPFCDSCFGNLLLSETKAPQPERDTVLQQLQLWLIECPTDKRFTLVRQQVEALVSEVPK